MSSWTTSMALALRTALDSPDPSTQNGAVLVCNDGRQMISACNEFPEGVQYSDERWMRPAKYAYVEHAERNVIFKAARKGLKVSSFTMVCPWAACADCARAIVQSGIKELVRFPLEDGETGNHWAESCAIGDTIMGEGGVKITEVPLSTVHLIPRLRRNEKIWTPA